MANIDNRGDNGSYEGNSSLPVVAGPTIPPINPTSGAANAPSPDPSLGAINVPTPALNQTVGPMAMSPLFYE
ncbi:UNVERIFIED_CONTAM: hypothetical protein Slati_4538800 [Sesamum latifolium]|uniref:Uncharacterized protein n=1 Tax=Sesamum latifolium TaxID=2727402 RepID=A0AAW2SHJ7_9LAMI